MTKLKVFLLFFVLFVAFAIGHTFHGAAMAPNTLKGWVVASDTGLVFHTPDCGLTWINQSFLTSRYFFDVFFLNGQKGWIGTDQGFVFYSPNGGLNWYLQFAGLSYYIYEILFIDDSCGWAACTRPMIGRTINGGQAWEQIFFPCPPFAYDTVDIHSISFVDRQKGWACAGRYVQDSYPYDTFFGGQGYIAKSIDGGLNWQLLKRDTIYDFFDIKFQDSLNGFVVGGNDRTMSAVVMRTYNGGNTWQPVTIPAQAKYLRSLKFIGNQVWAVGHRGTILHSDDEGNTWALQTCPVDTTLYDIDFSDSIHGLIAGDGYVLYTHDGGNIWHIANVSIEEEIASPNRVVLTRVVKIYPNPFHHQVLIQYQQLSTNSKLLIYDASGRLIKSFTDAKRSESNNQQLKTNNCIVWDGKDNSNRLIPNGVYFVVVKTDNRYYKAPIIYIGR